MNSEELEQSLRAEFESYLKGVFAAMRDETDEFQKKIDAEFESQKARIDEAFGAFSARFDAEHKFDEAFTEAVIEHMRLARDEGAQISAKAFTEAEEMERAATPEVNFADIKEAINDISSKDSQSSILKSLIHHAANYTPRGAFFIIKNEHFVGWKVFGKEGTTGEDSIREIHFPISADSILGKAVTSLTTVEGSSGTFPDDSAFLDALEFGAPDRMYAIPLTARGRGVAVLYADYGHEGVNLNTDALESLVRVAGMTVELLASAKTIRTAPDAASIEDHADSHDLNPTVDYSREEFQSAVASFDQHELPAFEEPVVETSFETPSAFAETTPFNEPTVAAFEPQVQTAEPAADEVGGFDFQPAVADDGPAFSSFKNDDVDEFASTHAFDVERVTDEPETESAPPVFSTPFEIPAPPVTESAMVFDAPREEDENPFEAAPFEEAKFDSSPFDHQVETFAPVDNGQAFEPAPAVEVETVSAVAAPPRSRLSDRNVDLPIDVAEDERRLHNDARRFARLLVSEIKLYNEKKVQEGREASDIYDRLREAIDRSREMYDKRVQPPVAAKFDYFHFEVVNALGEGDETRLGKNYPGATI
ncbi:MAG: hypothetical protein KA956_00115 [Pyrinomonadaceae bacterium]|nr:hypothetical protein [Acidobacteriota bacterium]MBP7374854.1 hypothetical protein [Pyrinomonadaceae bacterium]